MPQDPNLYGQRAATTKKKTELGLSNTLDFAAQLRSLIREKPKGGAGASSRTDASTKKRKSESLFSGGSKKKQKNSGASAGDVLQVGGDETTPATVSRVTDRPKHENWSKRDVQTGSGNDSFYAEVDAAEREHIRTKLAAKARRYALMQRGDYVPREGEAAPLVDFDRKWAERTVGDELASEDTENDTEDGSGEEDDEGGAHSTELVEHIDEFGRSRLVPRTVRDRALRRQARAFRAARELAELRARPTLPANGGSGGDGGDGSGLLYGDVIQTEAIETAVEGTAWQKKDVEETDDGVTPTHYRAQDDIRTRGAAFYAFAAEDEAARAAQMQALSDERAKTEAARAARRTELDARKQAVAARRAALAERKAAKLADGFLNGLQRDFLKTDGGKRENWKTVTDGSQQ
ncbi:hypothetical protein SPI_08303 [Niveomyces insectorum RCEF 264]|uniref:Uncharacterized protein n=1 Tax=Niveomyces insectorum RCEF 264 TaxID=1081102 RepID=A0A167N743_9HYPO|nr:hypothetical protein SPI_08303 [Niveomyces insectorum RCEF 264]